MGHVLAQRIGRECVDLERTLGAALALLLDVHARILFIIDEVLDPTATDDFLGADQWAIGPTGVALEQEGPWTYGVFANHLWSFVGDDDRPDVNSTFVQPFMAYTTPTAWTYSLNSECIYDWQTDDASIPVNATAAKVLKLGSQLVSVGGRLRYWVEEADNGPEGLGVRLIVTLLFPK